MNTGQCPDPIDGKLRFPFIGSIRFVLKGAVTFVSCEATQPATLCVAGGRSGWTRTIDLALIRRAL